MLEDRDGNVGHCRAQHALVVDGFQVNFELGADGWNGWHADVVFRQEDGRLRGLVIAAVVNLQEATDDALVFWKGMQAYCLISYLSKTCIIYLQIS